MRNPRRWRALEPASGAGGVIAIPAPFLSLPGVNSV